MEIHEVKLGDIATVKGGKRLPKGINLITKPNTHPYIRVRDLNGKRTLELDSSFEFVDDETQKTISRYIVNEGDIVLSIVGTIGLVAVIGKSLNEANLTENCVKLTSLSGVDRDFLYYFLKSSYGQQEITRGTVGAVQAKLPIKNIQDITIPLPDELTQRKIAAVLSSLDAKIETNKKINDNLHQQAATLFKALFVDLTPFDGTMPPNWTISTLGDATEMGAGGDKPKESSPVKTPLCPYPIYSNGINDYGLYGYTNDPKIKVESVTVSARGTIGYVCLRHTPYVPIVRLVTLIPDTKVLSAKYLYLYLRQLHITGTGTTQQQLTVPDFRKTEIIIPDKNTMDSFTETVTPLFEQIWANEDENTKLAEVRDALLPKLMSGEIDVSDIQL